MPLNDMGVSIHQLQGVGNITVQREMLRAMKAFPRYLLLVADREGDMAREVEGLKREGVLTNETTYLWDTSFEEANFSDEELVAMIATIGADSGATLTLDEQTLRARYNQQRDTAATRREHWRHSRSGLPARMSTGTSLLPDAAGRPHGQPNP